MQDDTPKVQKTVKEINVTLPELEELGEGLAEGAFNVACKWVVIGFLALLAFATVRNAFDLGVDSTDLNGWNRSGLTLHTDYGTGVQYLSDGKGGLIRREGAK